jgi:group I intron endonuclease
MLIYKWTNKVNGKIYIGQTTMTMSQRISCYKRDVKNLRENKFTAKHPIVFALKKYGFENFVCEVIDTATSSDELNAKEKYWIKKLGSRDSDIGYNLLPGGDRMSGENHPNYGKILSEEHKKKLSLIQKGKKLTKEHVRNIKKSWEQTKWKRSGKYAWSYGRKHSKETKEKLRASTIRQLKSGHPSAKLNKQQVKSIKKEYKLGTSTKELAQKYSISRSQIYFILSGRSWK